MPPANPCSNAAGARTRQPRPTPYASSGSRAGAPAPTRRSSTRCARPARSACSTPAAAKAGSRALAAAGCDVVGVDASPELIAAARGAGGARFEIASYADLAGLRDALGAFDAVVYNFALLGEDLRAPFAAAHRLLRDGGALLVQTVHPWAACGDAAYADGWRSETFAAFGGEFRAEMPWYFRTLASWHDAIRTAGFRVERWLEPADPATGKPLSLLAHAVR
ncbi:MAG TPA: class I SAM-dependent methyltransferase [Dokdonella sp.]